MSSIESGPVRPAIRTTIFVRAPKGAPIKVCTIADRILAEFSGSYVTAEDSFEAERERYRDVQAACERDEQAAEGFALVLESINRKEAATGPGIDLYVPVNGEGAFAGYVRSQSARFHTGLSPSHPSVRRFAELLEMLVGEPVQVVEAP